MFYASAYMRQERAVFYGGAYITIIARALLPEIDIDADPRCGPAILPGRLDTRTIQGMGILGKIPGVGRRLVEVFPVVDIEDDPVDPAAPAPQAAPAAQAAPQPLHPPQWPIHVAPDMHQFYQMQMLHNDADAVHDAISD